MPIKKLVHEIMLAKGRILRLPTSLPQSLMKFVFSESKGEMDEYDVVVGKPKAEDKQDADRQ